MCEGDSQNLLTAHHALAFNRDDSEQGMAAFHSRLTAAILKDFPSAVRLVRDHFPRYLDRLPGDLLFRFGVAFYQEDDIEKARRCLELAAGREGSWQPKAMLLVSRTYEDKGNVRRAIAVIKDLLARKPEKTFRCQALKRLMKLQPRGERTPF